MIPSADATKPLEVEMVEPSGRVTPVAPTINGGLGCAVDAGGVYGTAGPLIGGSGATPPLGGIGIGTQVSG